MSGLGQIPLIIIMMFEYNKTTAIEIKDEVTKMNLSSSNNNSHGEGFDESLFVSRPAEYLRCGICTLVLNNPIQILDCGHKYCHLCFERLKISTEQTKQPLHCPFDRIAVDVSRVFEDIGLKRLVGSLQVRCHHVEKGCEWIGELSELNSHMGKCEYQCHCKQKQVPSLHDNEVLKMVQKMSDRVDKCENLIEEKEKDISHLKFTVTELKAKFDLKVEEISQLKNEIRENQHTHEQLYKNLETELSHALKKIDMLDKKVLELQTENQNLKHEVREGEISRNKMLEKAKLMEVKVTEVQKENNNFKHEVREAAGNQHTHEQRHKKRETESLKTIDLLDTKVLEIQTENTKLKHEVREGEILKNKVAEKAKQMVVKVENIKPVLLMEARNKENRQNLVISKDNHIQFRDGWSTACLPNGVVGAGLKAFYEVAVLKGNDDYYLSVGWATKEFLTSDRTINKHWYAYRVAYSSSLKYDGNEWKTYGKSLVQGNNDVIGVALDMVNGQILFGFNGKWTYPMGMAYRHVDTKQNFFPFVSYREAELQVNFKEGSFVYGPPDDSYVSMHAHLIS